MTYEVVKNEYVLQTLEKGNEVIVCDFSTMKMIKCSELLVGAINNYKAKTETVFYKVIPDEE